MILLIIFFFYIAKVELIGGEALPGTALVSLGTNMPLFCREFNDQTQQRKGEVVPVAITVYIDKTFNFLLKTIPLPLFCWNKQMGLKKIKIGLMNFSYLLLKQLTKI